MNEALQTIDWPLPFRFFLALAISFLVGLERESASIRKPKIYAGVRTYSLIGVYGFGCAWMYHNDMTWMLPMGMLSITALITIGYLAKLRENATGWTSEVAALVTFITGALCLLAEIWVPMALGIISTFLLSEKSNLEKFVERLNKAEFLAVLKFLLITIIILPVLPDEDYTQFQLNPRHIWQIVVLVSTIGFIGYLLAKKLGNRVGLWLSGIMGGIVSSTAVSIAAGRMAQRNESISGAALQALVLASSVMYLRILMLIWIIQPGLAHYFWWKLIALAGIGVLLAIHRRPGPERIEPQTVQAPNNPFELKPAMIFAAMFVVMSIVTIIVRNFYGNTGLAALSVFTGVTDIDPFILSLVNHNAQFQSSVATAILLAMMSNTMVKGVYFAFLAKTTRTATLWRFALWALLHIPILLLPF